MKIFPNRRMRACCLLMCLLLCLCWIPSCGEQSSSLEQSGFSSLTLDGKGRVTATVTLDARDLQAHTGEQVLLYELLPGETTAALGDREPLGTSKVRASVKFRFSLTDGEHTRLYSSFVIGFSDGSFLSTSGYWIENPSVSASETRAFPWTGSAKGLNVDDVDSAAELGVLHAMYELKLSDFWNGSDSIAFDGKTYAVSMAALERLDGQIADATAAGMQVSLTVVPDVLPTPAGVAAVFDCLAERYGGGANGLVSAFFVGASANLSAADSALWCRLAGQALRARVANGRVYVVCGADTLIDAKAFFADVQRVLVAGGETDWGAAVIPATSGGETVLTGSDGSLLSLDQLGALSQFLSVGGGDGRPAWFAVCGLTFSAADGDAQAASYAYAYRSAQAASATLVFYGAHADDDAGLLSARGAERRITSLFAAVDVGLTDADASLCAAQLGAAWDALPALSATRRTVSGISNVGTSGLEESDLFDFTSGDLYGFTGVRSVTAPESHLSGTWSAPVLYTWVSSADGAAGVRKYLPSASALQDAVSLSVSLLTQASDADACVVSLRLCGVARDGTIVTYESDAEVRNGVWQSVTFQIGNFVADADLSRPCVLTLVTSPMTDTTEDYVLWVRGVNVRYPDSDSGVLLPLLLMIGCLAVSFLLGFLLYRRTLRRRR